MTKNTPPQDQDEPLDPAVEAIRVKLVRLLMVSGGIMLLGFMAVFMAIVYKWNKKPDVAQTPSPESVVSASGTLLIPKNAKIVSTSATAAGLVLTIQLANGKTVIQRHDNSGNITSRFSVIEE